MSRSPRAKDYAFETIAPVRAVDEIESQIRSMIAQGKLKPGDRLPSERDLAALLGVSRNTLRESLRSLEYAGIVETKKGGNGGTYILHGNSGAIVEGLRVLYDLGGISPQQLTEARVWLSDTVVRVACERATEEDFQALEENIEATRRADKDGEFDQRQKLNREFHLVLARVTRNTIIISMMEAVMSAMGYFIEQIGPRDNSFTLPARRRLMKHLRNRDANAAAEEMATYLGRLQSGYLDQWAERNPDQRPDNH